jgi:hypothetical protein
MFNSTRVVAVAIAAAILTMAGCDSNKQSQGKVSGKVTYNGATVTGGSVTFFTADNTPLQVPIGADGLYVVPNVPEGPVTVVVETESLNKKAEEYRGGGAGKGMYGKGGGGQVPKGKGMEYSPGPAGGGGASPIYVKIPAKYADKATSGLTTTVKKGDQTYNIELTD